MKRGHVILIVGAALLVAGIALASMSGVSFAANFMSSNTIIGQTTIAPGQSASASTDVRDIGKTVTLTVGLDRTQQQPSDARLKETITDPQGKVVSSGEFSDSFVTSVKPEVTGTYTVTVTNMGSSAVSVAGTLGDFPIIGADGRPDLNTLFGTGQQGLGLVIGGGIMSVAGVAALIVGGIVTVADSRAQHRASTTEGGITYRKE